MFQGSKKIAILFFLFTPQAMAFNDSFQSILEKGLTEKTAQETAVSQTVAFPTSAEVTRVTFEERSGYVKDIYFQQQNIFTTRGSNLDDAVDRFLSEFLPTIGVSRDEISSVMSKQTVSGKTYLHLERVINDVSVKDSYLDLVFTDESNPRLYSVHAQVFPEASVHSPQLHLYSRRNVTDLLKAKVGIQDLGLESYKPVYVYEAGQLHLTFQIDFKVFSTGKRYQVYLNSDQVFEARPYELSFAEEEAELRAEVYPRSYVFGKTEDVILKDLNVQYDSNSFISNFFGKIPFIPSAELRLNFQGDRFRLTTGGRAYATRFSSYEQEENQVFLKPSSEQSVAFNAYHALMQVNQYARRFLREKDTSFLARRTLVRLNYSGSCNAFYTGNSISLYRSSSSCANMALVGDVVLHEWGHGIDDYTGKRGGITSGAFSEGIGDIVSAYYYDSPNMGAGFHRDREKGIRQLDNNNSYPRDRGGVHYEGLIIGGSFWHLREAMIERYGERKGSHLAADLFYKHLLITDTYGESYRNVLLIDDDDNDASTPSPNHCLITKAFARHGLARNTTCQDAIEDIDQLPALQDLEIALESEAKQKTHFLFATSEQKDLLLCQGDSVDCESGKVEIEFLGTKGDRFIYRTKQEQDLKEHGFYTMLSLEGQEVLTQNQFGLATQ